MLNITDNTLPQLRLGDNKYDTGTFTAAGAATYPAGTVLARLAADSKFVVYDSGGAGGAEIPKAILPNDLTTAGAGDTLGVRVMISGSVRRDSTTAYNGGTPLQLTALEQDLLRDFTLVTQPVTELLRFDNS